MIQSRYRILVLALIINKIPHRVTSITLWNCKKKNFFWLSQTELVIVTITACSIGIEEGERKADFEKLGNLWAKFKHKSTDSHASKVKFNKLGVRPKRVSVSQSVTKLSHGNRLKSANLGIYYIFLRFLFYMIFTDIFHDIERFNCLIAGVCYSWAHVT